MNEQSLFSRAVEIADPAERAAFLDRACVGDAALRQRVDRLLDRLRDAGSFLGQPAHGMPGAGGPPSTPHWEAAGRAGPALTRGSAVGPYKPLELIGEGGMGSVWMAEQTEPVRRKVALKVVKPGMDSRQVVARFEAERQ